jgi:hypothetical protein
VPIEILTVPASCWKKRLESQTSAQTTINSITLKKLHLSKVHPVISTVVFTIAMGVLSLGSHARAQTYSAAENVASFSTFSQLNSGVTYENFQNVSSNACVPTATANALSYLQNTYGITNLVLSGYDTVNTLAQDMGTYQGPPNPPGNGTYFSGQTNGLNTYLTDQGVSSMVSIAETAGVPTVASLYDWLTDSNAVTVWINWNGTGTDGFHALTLYSISYTDVSGSISGSLGFLDPWGAPAGSNSVAADVSAATFVVVNGLIDITNGYFGGAGGSTNDPDKPGASSTGTVQNGLDIAAVPEPSVFGLFGLGGLALAFAYRRRSA